MFENAYKWKAKRSSLTIVRHTKCSKETLETVNAKSKAKNRFWKTQSTDSTFQSTSDKAAANIQTFNTNAKVCRCYGKVHTQISHILLKMQHVFNVTERGHYSSQCLTRTVEEITDPLQELDT